MSAAEQLTPYAELADVTANLPLLLREARRARGLSLRAAASELGVSFSTVTRIENGEDCALSNAVAVLRWLDQRQPVRPTCTCCGTSWPHVPSSERCTAAPPPQ